MYVLEPVNECTKTVLFVTFIIRASLVDPPSGYSRLGPATSITNVVMVTVVATYITGPICLLPSLSHCQLLGTAEHQRLPEDNTLSAYMGSSSPAH